MSKIYDFCETELPPQLMSAKNLLTLDYVVKSLNSRTPKANDDFGFVLEYRFLSDYGHQPDEAIRIPNESIYFCKMFMI